MSLWRIAVTLFACLTPGLRITLALAQSDGAKPCLAQDEIIYMPGQEHVKAPKLRIERGSLEQPLRSSSRAVFEVVINSVGTICEVRALKAPDRETAQKLAEHIADSFRFSPAIRKGKPVAARFRVIFHVQGTVETE